MLDKRNIMVKQEAQYHGETRISIVFHYPHLY